MKREDIETIVGFKLVLDQTYWLVSVPIPGVHESIYVGEIDGCASFKIGPWIIRTPSGIFDTKEQAEKVNLEAMPMREKIAQIKLQLNAKKAVDHLTLKQVRADYKAVGKEQQ